VVAERGSMLAETFNHLSKSLQAIQGDLKEQIELGSVTEVNALLDQINGINDQIKKIEPHGFLPNDLYDERDRLLDRLATIVNINVSYSKSSDSPKELDIADGVATIEVLNESGQSFSPPVFLLDGTSGTVNELSVA